MARRKSFWAKVGGAVVSGALAVDMLFNGLFFCGDFRQTISACWGQMITVSVVARAGCAVLDLVDPNHCAKAAGKSSRLPASTLQPPNVSYLPAPDGRGRLPQPRLEEHRLGVERILVHQLIAHVDQGAPALELQFTEPMTDFAEQGGHLQFVEGAQKGLDASRGTWDPGWHRASTVISWPHRTNR